MSDSFFVITKLQSIRGNFNNPIIESNSNLKNLDLTILSKKIDLKVENIQIIPQIIKSNFGGAKIQIQNFPSKFP